MTESVPYTSTTLAEQAAALRLASFTVSDAVALGTLAVTRASEKGLGIVIMVRHTGRTVFQAALPGSVADSDEWVVRKARTVERFGLATLAQFVRAEERGRDFHASYFLSPAEFAAHGGGIPIEVPAVGVVGGFYASGLPHVDDHDFLIAVLSEFRDAR
jgi:uncharacterized protein (UPF0303 family)